MIPEKFYDLAERFKDDESVFGFYYQNYNGQDRLLVSGGDWMDEETYGPINQWCVNNNVEVEYEAEADDEYCESLGYQLITRPVQVKVMTIEDLIPNPMHRLSAEDLEFSDDVFKDVVADDSYQYGRILKIYHKTILDLLEKISILSNSSM